MKDAEHKVPGERAVFELRVQEPGTYDPHILPDGTRTTLQPDGSTLEEPARIEVGDDAQTRAERDMGLAINPDTGRAYESQGQASNLATGLGGRFHDGIMVPRVFHCDACQAPVTERRFGEGFPNCGALGINPGRYAFLNCGSLNLGLGGQFNLCGGCIERMVNAVPNLAGIVAATNGGKVRA